MIGRRTFLGAAALAMVALPRGAGATPATTRRRPRVGVIGEISPVPWTVRTAAVDFECRWADGRHERLSTLAAEIVDRGVDVIVALGWRATRAVRQVTTRVPIVFVVEGETVREGLDAGLARPAGNLTGFVLRSETELARRRLTVLARIVPRLERVAVLWTSDSPRGGHVFEHLRGHLAGKPVELLPFTARSVEEIDRAFESMREARVGAVLALPDALFTMHGDRLVELAARERLPAAYAAPSFVEAGGLLAVHGDTAEAIQRVAGTVGRILAGARPATLPVQVLGRVALVVNLDTTRALQLRLPQSLLAIAHSVVGG